jgi:predicted RNA methylase
VLKVIRPTDGQKNLGSVYTPHHLAVWLARHVKSLGCLPNTIVDPAAGVGALLEASALVFPTARLFGLDLDEQAHTQLVARGWAARAEPCDALLADDWFATFNEGSKLVFSNPPWGAKVDSASADAYKRVFANATGAFDTFDLFVERTIKSLERGDWAALFLPDSILLPNHARTRRLIQENTLIHSVTRLPEGTFPGVSMGCVAIVIQKIAIPNGNSIKFSRISRSNYFSVRPTPSKIEAYRLRGQSEVPQSQWLGSSAATWHGNHTNLSELNLPSSLIDHCSEVSGSTWDLWFTTGRGLEIGKKALVKGYPPVSISDEMIPIAVGEDVSRRSVAPSRLLSMRAAEDLKMKKELMPGQRLLVRKTGIGIKASIATDVVTTQTVYHFRAKSNAPTYALHYAAGFLTSRVLIAIHLAKTGETEWRSHPYVTQKVVRDLQLPIPNAGSKQEKIAKEIAAISESLHLREDLDLEDRLDLLVSELLGHSEELVTWSKMFLANIDGCSYTKLLCTASESKKSA